MPRARKRSVHGSGSVYQRKSDERWVAKFKVEETGKYKLLYASTEKEAYKKLEDALFEQKQGILATGPQQTVKQFLEYWIGDVQKPPMVRLGTYEMYRTVIDKYLIPGLGHIKLQKLTAQQIQSFYGKEMKKGVSAGRIRYINSVLHKALVHAKRIKLIQVNVSDEIELSPAEEHEIEPLTPEQTRLLLQKVREHQLEALLTLAITTGMRKGEILGLRWQDIDLQEGVLQIRRTLGYFAHHGFVEGEPKTKKSKHKITLPQFVIDALKRHQALQLERRLQAGSAWVNKDLVFSSKDGDFIVPHTLNNHFNRLLEDIGLPHIRFHDLRHSAATLLLSMGVPAKVVQEILGHSNFSTTMNRYSHVLPTMQKEAMDKMDDMFGGQR
jgi:integrase